MVTLNDKILTQTSLGALGVISGVVIKNTYSQMEAPKNKDIAEMIGTLVFVVGWLTVLHAVVMKGKTAFVPSQKNIASIASVAGILGSVFIMKSKMKAKEEIHMMYPLIFSASWLALGYNIGEYGNAASVMVILSMLFSLPWQRKNCIVDGPGMPLFVAAWALIAYSNSH